MVVRGLSYVIGQISPDFSVPLPCVRGGETRPILVTGQVHLDFRDVHFAIFIRRTAGLVHLLPIRAAAAARPARIMLHLALAFNSRGAVGQGVEPGYRDLALAVLANPIRALLHPRQGTFDLA